VAGAGVGSRTLAVSLSFVLHRLVCVLCRVCVQLSGKKMIDVPVLAACSLVLVAPFVSA
jgi:hypothetical protein